jgi:putative oxidoreductase
VPGPGVLATVALRLLLVVLFFPCSALDKTVNFAAATAQARSVFAVPALARGAVLAGLAIEVVMPLAILTGVADRLGALVLAFYCVATAVLFKRFWATGDFWCSGASRGRELFWDFLKNFSLAGGLLLITFGPAAHGVPAFLAHPLGSTHPYARGGG